LRKARRGASLSQYSASMIALVVCGFRGHEVGIWLQQCQQVGSDLTGELTPVDLIGAAKLDVRVHDEVEVAITVFNRRKRSLDLYCEPFVVGGSRDDPFSGRRDLGRGYRDGTGLLKANPDRDNDPTCLNRHRVARFCRRCRVLARTL
jgi:hypothetical protein